MSPHRLIVGIAPLRVNAEPRMLAATACACAAGVHAGLTPEHYREAPVLGVAFTLSVVALGVAALLLRRSAGSTWSWIVPPVVLLGVAACYVLSRTTGLPPLIPEPEDVDGLGLLTTLAEVLAAVAAIRLPHDRKEHR